jgi:hypothetical protein
MRPFPPLLASLSSVLLACDGPSAPTSPAATAEATSLPTAALVERFDDRFFQVVVDGDLAAVVGLGPEQLPAFCAGDESVLDPIHFLVVSRPDGSLKQTVRASPRVIIYPIAGVSNLCELTAVTPLATGKAHMAHTDNDFFVSLNRTNSFGSNLSGIASGEGGRFKVRARFRITIQRNGEIQVRTERSGITPLGG